MANLDAGSQVKFVSNKHGTQHFAVVGCFNQSRNVVRLEDALKRAAGGYVPIPAVSAYGWLCFASRFRVLKAYADVLYRIVLRWREVRPKS